MAITVYLAADHAGFNQKTAVAARLASLGYVVDDLGAHAYEKEDDYPDFVSPLAERVAQENGSFGIVFGGSGQGEAMCANRIPGVRAAVYYGTHAALQGVDVQGKESEDGFDAIRLPRRHNNANVLSIGARFVSDEDAVEAARIFLETDFSGEERHRRRIAKY